MRWGLGEKFGVAFSFAVVVTARESSLILCIARSGLGGSLEGGVQGAGGEEENKGLSSLSGTLVVATTE